MRTIDLKFQEVCEEIDEWKAEALYWKKKYEKLQLEYNENINKDIQNNYNLVGKTLGAIINPNNVLNKNTVNQ